MSEYFLAGLKEGGASILKSRDASETEIKDDINFSIREQFIFNFIFKNQ